MPNRREPVTKFMLLCIIRRSQGHPPHSMIAVLADWCLLDIYFSFRLSEFLQLQHNIRSNKIQCNADGLPQAFILSDITFYGPQKRVLHLYHSRPVDPSRVTGFPLRWRYQKNLQNGEVKIMVRNDRNPILCSVRAILRI